MARSKDNKSSLACLFDVEYENLSRIFVICSYCFGANGSRFKTNAFDNFKTTDNLDVNSDKYLNSIYHI